MQGLGFEIWLGFFSVLLIIAAVGIYSSRKVKTAQDYSLGGRKMGPMLVSASLMGTFVGGTSIVGTAQASFFYGISGIWFTLGAGLSCLFMAIFLARPLRTSGVETIPQLLEQGYNRTAGLWANFYTSIGIFIQIATQVLAAIPLMGALFSLTPSQSALGVTLLILCYVVFGGFVGTTWIGLIKMTLLYFSMAAAVIVLLQHSGGISLFLQNFSYHPWFNLLAQGAAKELGSGISVIIGFTSTQSYLQALFAGRDATAARRGALIAAIFIPLVGLGSVMIGMFMRIYHPGINPADALPLFVLEYISPWLAGIILATLLISLIMTAAGLTLGLSTMFNRDFYRNIIRPMASDRELILVFRFTLILIAALAFFFTLGNIQALILKLAFLSMALRGVTVFLPILGVVFWKDLISPTAGKRAIIYAPAASLLWALLLPDVLDPLYIGVVISFFLLFGQTLYRGLQRRRNKDKRTHSSS